MTRPLSLRRAIQLALRHRALLDRLILLAGVGSTFVVVLVALVLRRGSWPEQRFLLVYVAPLLLYGKLLLWHDASSWSLGIAAGLALAILRAVDYRTRRLDSLTVTSPD